MFQKIFMAAPLRFLLESKIRSVKRGLTVDEVMEAFQEAVHIRLDVDGGSNVLPFRRSSETNASDVGTNTFLNPEEHGRFHDYAEAASSPGEPQPFLTETLRKLRYLKSRQERTNCETGESNASD